MSKKEFFLVILAAGLGVLYAVFYTNVFRSKPIHIEHTIRSLREAWNSNGRRVDTTGRDPTGVTFSLNQDYRLTSVKVVPLAEWQTNRYAVPVWELVSRAGSPPVNSFGYGLPIRGMTPSPPGAGRNLWRRAWSTGCWSRPVPPKANTISRWVNPPRKNHDFPMAKLE